MICDPTVELITVGHAKPWRKSALDPVPIHGEGLLQVLSLGSEILAHLLDAREQLPLGNEVGPHRVAQPGLYALQGLAAGANLGMI
jgi:hypothetical protein